MKEISPIDKLSVQYSRFIADKLQNDSDVICVIAGAAFLDAALGSFIQIKLGLLDESKVAKKLMSGALGGFATRADLVYSMGCIHKEYYQDLATIAEVRNEFAHNHINHSFEETKAREICDKLQAWKIYFENKDETTPKYKFMISVSVISEKLLELAAIEKQK